MSLIIPIFCDAREYYGEYCLTTTEAVHLSANYTVQGASTQSRLIPFQGVITQIIFKYTCYKETLVCVTKVGTGI